MIDDFTAGVTSKRLDDGNGPLLVFRRALGRDVGRKRRKPGSQETHQDSVVKEATLHLYRRNHGSASAVTDVTPSLSAITASFKITAKRVATAYIRRTAIAS